MRVEAAVSETRVCHEASHTGTLDALRPELSCGYLYDAFPRLLFVALLVAHVRASHADHIYIISIIWYVKHKIKEILYAVPRSCCHCIRCPKPAGAVPGQPLWFQRSRSRQPRHRRCPRPCRARKREGGRGSD